jgi:Flp pilus assembly protein TadB
MSESSGLPSINTLKNCCLKAFKTVASPWSKAKHVLEKDGQTCPRSDTVLLSLLSLIIFLVAAVFALVFPTTTIKNFIIALNATLAGVLGLIFAFDLARRKHLTTLAKKSE